MPPAPELTAAQQRTLEMVRREFPSARKRGYRIDRNTGHMRVRTVAAAGEWTWVFDRDGLLIDKSLRMALFDASEGKAPPRSAIDN